MSVEIRRPLLSEREAASLLGMSVRTLQGWRWMGRGPTFIRICGSVRYVEDDLANFVREGRRENDAAAPLAAANFR
jgi:predicted site-specific integrase-resolvase